MKCKVLYATTAEELEKKANEFLSENRGVDFKIETPLFTADEEFIYLTIFYSYIK